MPEIPHGAQQCDLSCPTYTKEHRAVEIVWAICKSMLGNMRDVVFKGNER